MDYLTLAFFIGLFGSLHCVAMCGPLVLALPMDRQSKATFVFNKLVYQAGRIMVYGIFGLVVGLAGNAISFNGWQQYISLGTAVLLLAFAAFQLVGRRLSAIAKWQQVLVEPIIRKMGYWLYRPGGNFIAGMLNGFLPCGMVYMALAAAFNADSALNSAFFMLLFGAGTLPAMLTTVLLGSTIKRMIPINMAKWLPVMLVLMGVWFLLRGANLDVPYLSPVIFPEGAVMCGAM